MSPDLRAPGAGRRGLRAGVVLGAIGLLAAGLRLAAIGWGLPDVHHPDEPYILNRALAFAKGDLSPHNFLYPTLYFYALFAWEGLFFLLGRLAGWYGSVSAFEREYFSDPTRLMIAGRSLTALFGYLHWIQATLKFEIVFALRQSG